MRPAFTSVPGSWLLEISPRGRGTVNVDSVCTFNDIIMHEYAHVQLHAIVESCKRVAIVWSYAAMELMYVYPLVHGAHTHACMLFMLFYHVNSPVSSGNKHLARLRFAGGCDRANALEVIGD